MNESNELYNKAEEFYSDYKKWDLQSDHNLAMDNYKYAAEKGNQKAQLFLGQFHRTHMGGPKNIPVAIEMLEKASNQGNAEAMFVLAQIYQELDNEDEQIITLTKSAEHGYNWAQLKLGKIHYDRYQESSRPDDFINAMDMFRKSGQAGIQFILEMIADARKVGCLHKDIILAMKWFDDAAMIK